jgi:hypothetical protein
MTVNGVRITQHELQEIFDLQRDVSDRMKRLEELKSSVKALLFAKMPVEYGRFDAQLLRRISRHVPWKQAVIEELGLAFVDAFRKRYQATVFFDVMVVEHAVPPLWKGKEGSIGTGE